MIDHLELKISVVIDFEYSGRGFKEKDIYWTLILRSGKNFMDNIEDKKILLKDIKLKVIITKNI